MIVIFLFFFFSSRRRHTRFDCDWSSDVCSSDLSHVSPFPFPEERREVRFSNLEKIFWPDERYTKGDLIEYYRAVSPWMLRYLADRPLVLTRFPDGINGKSFFQKDAPAYAQAFVRTVTIWSEDSQRELDYFVCDNEASLLYIANMAAILLHIWSSG